MFRTLNSAVLGILAAAAVSSAGHAAILYPPAGNFGLLTVPGDHSMGFVGIGTSPSFSDLYTFSLDSTDHVAIKFGSSFASPIETIDGFTVSLYSGTVPPDGFLTSATASVIPGTVPGSGGESGLLTTVLGQGAYSFVVSGTTRDNPSYSGTVTISLSTVPLPASAPMFGAALLGLGAVGYGVKRRKAAAAA